MKRTLKSLIAAICLTGVAASAQIPRPAPDLAIKSPTGMVSMLSKYKGKAVALEFVLTTCPHCQQSCRILTKMHHEFGSQGFTPVAVAINEMAHMYVDDFVKQFGITFQVGWQVHDTAMQFLQHPVMKPMMMPQIVFIDKEGVIRAQFEGSDPFFADELKQEANMRTQIKKLLQPQAAAKKAAPAAAAKK